MRGLWCHLRVGLRGQLMARRQSRMLPLGTTAPVFALRDTVSGRTVALEDAASSPVLLIAFICNHCPFVKHILDGFVAFARDFGPRLWTVVAGFRNNGITDGTRVWWIPVVAPLLGALAGAALYDFGVRRFLRPAV